MRKFHLLSLVKAALFSAILCVCSLISIPFGAAPLTLQTLALFLALMSLGGTAGLLSVCIYVSIGALGLPVFSGFSGGVGALFGPYGGFIFGFIICSLIYLLLETVFGKRGRRPLVFSLICLPILYTCQVLWHVLIYSGGDGTAFLAVIITYVLPFILPDVIKILISYNIFIRIKKLGFFAGEGYGKRKNRQD